MRRPSGARLGLIAVLAVVAAAGVGVMAASAMPYNSSDVTNAALDALSHQYDAVTAGAASMDAASAVASNARFRGRAATDMMAMVTQQRANAASGEIYPGIIELSNVKILAMSGSPTSVKVDLQAHEKLTNLRHGDVVGYSESEIAYRLVLDSVGDRWVVSQLDWEFAPGYEP
ncbi:MAG: hypothetical protein ACYDAN_15800 [Candidatus Limnocylindrales bacterium]